MAQNKFQPCRLCSTPTPAVVNINLKAVPVCEGCCGAIFIQQARWYVQQDYSHLYKPQLTKEEKAVTDMIGVKGDGEWEICKVQTPIGTKGYSGKFVLVKTNGRKVTHEMSNGPKITLKIIKSLKLKGIIREYSTITDGRGVISTFYKKDGPLPTISGTKYST